MLTARLLYDTTCMHTIPSVEYELTLPVAGPPGWAEENRSAKPDGTMSFAIRAPFPVQAGTYWFKLRVTAAWSANRAVVERDVPWVVLPIAQG